MRALIVDPAKNTVEVADIGKYKDPESYKEIQKVIGGYFDVACGVLTDGREFTIYVDDEGLCKGLPLFSFGNGIEAQDNFAGKAVILGPVDDDGDDTALADDITSQTLAITFGGRPWRK